MRHLGEVELFDFQVILYDTNNFLIQLGEGEPEAGAGATIGIENQTPSSIGLDYACETADSMPANRGVLFCAPGNICPAELPETQPVPTLSVASFLILMLLIAGVGVVLLGRRVA